MLPSRISQISAKGRFLSVSLSQVYSVTFATSELSRRLKMFIISEEKDRGGDIRSIKSIINKDLFSIIYNVSKLLVKQTSDK